MKKYFLLLAASLMVSTISVAQSGNGLSLSFGPELSIPFNTNSYDYGHIRDYYADGIGGNVKLGLPLGQSFGFILSAGFVSYAGKGAFIVPAVYTPGPNGDDEITPSPTSHYTFIPATAGLRYYLAKALYIGGEAGVAVKVYTNSSTNVIYGGGAGVMVPAGKHGAVDLSLKYIRGYEIYYYPSPLSQLSIGAAYRFGL